MTELSRATIEGFIADLDREIIVHKAQVKVRKNVRKFLRKMLRSTNSAASTQELPRPMEGAADRGEVRPGLAASNIAPVAMGEADAVDLTASADQSTAARMDAQAEQSHRLGAEGCDDASLFVPLDAPDSGYQAPPVDTNSPETADAGEVGPETVGASPAQSSTRKPVGPSGSAAPSLADKLRKLHAEHPEFTVQQVARELGETFERVRNNSNAHKIKWGLEHTRTVGLRDRVAELHAEHPDWTDAEIAAEIGKSNGYVRATAQRLGIVLPSRKRPAPVAEAEPVEADPPAEAPEPAPEPESPPASTPEPAIDTPRVVRPRSGSKFYLVNDKDEFLNRYCGGFTRDRREAWIGTQDQLVGCRRNFDLARDLTERPVARELPPAPINREVA